jgi:hypothetical protein
LLSRRCLTPSCFSLLPSRYFITVFLLCNKVVSSLARERPKDCRRLWGVLGVCQAYGDVFTGSSQIEEGNIDYVCRLHCRLVPVGIRAEVWKTVGRRMHVFMLSLLNYILLPPRISRYRSKRIASAPLQSFASIYSMWMDS